MFNIFKPARHRAPLPKETVDSAYKRYRFQVFLGIFIGYAGYYLVRKNFSLAIPYLQQQGFDKGDLGLVLAAVSIAYGLSKFVMGTISDRSNPRTFLTVGLLLSALINLFFGAASISMSSIPLMFCLMFLNGWFQGMGWPACGRTMVHWFSVGERGTKMSIWNVAHNVGGGLIGPLAIMGLALFSAWQSLFYFPALIAIVVAIFVFFSLRDTPQSVGLPPIEVYNNDCPAVAQHNEHNYDHERELTTREILFKYVLNNKLLWYIALANVFVYLVRYGVIDWAPTYLTEAKGFDHKESNWAYFLYEYAGIPGTIVCGWLSDKVFRGQRAPAAILYMLGVVGAVLVYWLSPAGYPWVDSLALIAIGFLIYGPVMLIGVQALDLVPKKAAGTAAGLTGLFGYLGGAVLANALMGYIVQYLGWRGGFIMLVAACILAIFFLSLTWSSHSKKKAASVANMT
ncbi:G-3-P permease [Piscirickettsia salmonis]|uniref:Glycerol-3-phosphate transporter n=1 Tax=Piscirickettsia salmonis TaxID=1238 RepID=A0A9Q6LJS3_PISSA|nr:glycerol-3-phosphate transporter [Piscirickettsia salmonis]QGN94943.1 G-3-P permease [Piscirickettsia salmonis]QGO06107.1 G-3-P permease [Piscirickettsia salmonis]QGO34433.1 G-3-P permease [Piscirickettsia salmonis]QGO38039.1 G-3-P permease [Piscirickettsia salmonis]QGO41667.1 G-3-P permease [Piscirickettsia salmonis]